MAGEPFEEEPVAGKEPVLPAFVSPSVQEYGNCDDILSTIFRIVLTATLTSVGWASPHG